MGIDFSSLKKAIGSLERAVNRAKKNTHDEEIRDAVIQRFEYTYELCWKLLKRQLEVDSPNPSSIDALSFRDLIREGAERQLIENTEKWFGYREQRNITSHTYDEAKAARVYETALKFLNDAKKLLKKLEERQS